MESLLGPAAVLSGYFGILRPGFLSQALTLDHRGPNLVLAGLELRVEGSRG